MDLLRYCKVSAFDNGQLDSYLRKRHSVSKLVVHLVFTTKYRRKLFTGVMIEQLREAFESACVKLECELIEMDGEQESYSFIDSLPTKTNRLASW